MTPSLAKSLTLRCPTSPPSPEAALFSCSRNYVSGFLSTSCWRQRAKGPQQWRTTRTTLPLVDGSGNITRLAGWRAGDFTLRALPLEGKAQKRIVRPAALGNAGSACCTSGSTTTILPNRPILHCHRQRPREPSTQLFEFKENGQICSYSRERKKERERERERDGLLREKYLAYSENFS